MTMEKQFAIASDTLNLLFSLLSFNDLLSLAVLRPRFVIILFLLFLAFLLYICEAPFLLSFNDLLDGICKCHSLDLLFLLLAFNDFISYLTVLFSRFVVFVFLRCFEPSLKGLIL